MSIQRYGWDLDFMEEDPDGEYVLYADHVAAVAEAEQRAVEQYQTAMRPVDVRATQLAIQQGVADERARIRQAVEALGPLLNVYKDDGGYDCCGCSTTYDLHEHVLSIIDGDK